MISKHILLIILNKTELIFFAQLKVFPYFYLIQIIRFTINQMLAHSSMFLRIVMHH